MEKNISLDEAISAQEKLESLRSYFKDNRERFWKSGIHMDDTQGIEWSIEDLRDLIRNFRIDRILSKLDR